MNESKGGVRNVQVGPDHDGQRVDNFISARLKGVPRSLVYRLIRTGQVRINGKRCKPAQRVSEGDTVRIPPAPRGGEGEIEVPDRVAGMLRKRIVHIDSDMLVLDKPCGMAVHAGSGLAWGVIDAMRVLFPDEYIELVHRLDRETSGCLVLARSGQALKRLSEQFRLGAVDKRYLCLMDGRLPEALVETDAPLKKVSGDKKRQVEVSPDGKSALTRFRLLKALGAASYVEAELLTGRTHQIRVHAAHIGLPLAGDGLYAPREAVSRFRSLGLKRLFLHAHRLELEDASGDRTSFEAPLPEELRELLNRLEGA